MIKTFNSKREYWVISPNYNQITETFINKLTDEETNEIQWIKCNYPNMKIGIPIEKNRIFEKRKDAEYYCKMYSIAKMLSISKIHKYSENEIQEAKDLFPHLFL